MTFVDPQRYRERLVVLAASLKDDGLEELILRLVRRDYPDAHRTRHGRDGGIDVLSDYGTPPERAWQAKNNVDGDVDWRHCRNSLKAAMEGPNPPPRYTFVFPRKLKYGERNYWRDTFHDTELAKYDQLERLDYVDDLPSLLEDRPDLVERMSDGAFGDYFRTVMQQTGATGVNPLASAPDLVGDAAALARRAKAIGRDDPYFVYGKTGREVGQRDTELPDRIARFTLEHGTDGLPKYAMALRDGDVVEELTAELRPDATIDTPEPWFADTPEGRVKRDLARAALAKGMPVDLDGDGIGVDPGTVPDRFRSMLTGEGLLRNGSLTLGLSIPLLLTATVTVDGVERSQGIPLFRVPPVPGIRSRWLILGRGGRHDQGRSAPSGRQASLGSARRAEDAKPAGGHPPVGPFCTECKSVREGICGWRSARPRELPRRLGAETAGVRTACAISQEGERAA